MKNWEIKPLFKEIIPEILSGNFNRGAELANLIGEYTWSYSSIKNILKSDKSFLWNLIKPFEETDATIFGSLVHAIALKQDLSKYIFEVKLDGRKKEGKEQKARWDEMRIEGKIVLDPSIEARAISCVDALRSNKRNSEILDSDGKCEVWLHRDYEGFKLGGYIDKLGDSVTEIKTATDASREKFMRSCIDYCYTIQAYIYNVLTQKPVFYPVVETSEPFNVASYEASEVFLEHGKYKLHECIDKLSDLQNSLCEGKLLSYGDSKIGIPGWEVNKLKSLKEGG